MKKAKVDIVDTVDNQDIVDIVELGLQVTVDTVVNAGKMEQLLRQVIAVNPVIRAIRV